MICLASAVSLRRDTRILKLPPYVSLLCIIIGVIWLLLLPQDRYSRQTYISENALLPGQVHTYFGGSEQNIFRAYRREVDHLADKANHEVNRHIETLLKAVGIKVGSQNFTYHFAGQNILGENVYGILKAPRGDAAEAIVLVAAWEGIEGVLNRNGVALILTLARYFKRWSLWSKDIIFVIPPDSKTGAQAWMDAYHDAHDSSSVASLPLKSGALQGAIAIDYPGGQSFEGLHIAYEGTNGQLPNLDLINSVVNIAGGQMGMETAVQDMKHYGGQYSDRLKTMITGMVKQGLGKSAGPHSSFIPYHVDSLTLQSYGQGWHDEMAMGRVVEGTFRSLNNLLEHFHQSFFFYLLMQRDRFVSIGTYLPSAMLLSANFTITAIFLWVKSGQPKRRQNQALSSEPSKGKREAVAQDRAMSLAHSSTERELALPFAVVTGCQALSIVPLFVFNRTHARVSIALPMTSTIDLPVCTALSTLLRHVISKMLSPAFAAVSIISAVLPPALSRTLSASSNPKIQHFQLAKSFSLLILGMTLATLATLNFSLAFLVGLLASPLSFVKPTRNVSTRCCSAGLLCLVAPPVVVFLAAQVWNVPIQEVLRGASFGWNVWGMHTAVVVWCLWWPAWLVGMINVLGIIPL